jgi:branched-chain amino acid transport system permease protein
LSGTAAAAGLGAIVGALAIRRQGIYFAMITLALAQMMYFFAIQAPFTHGEDGIQAVPRGRSASASALMIPRAGRPELF